MKEIDLLSLTTVFQDLDTTLFESYKNLHKIKIRDSEVEVLRKLVNEITFLESNAKILDAFYVGYEIPQIGKEFDLLRIGENNLINIELKSQFEIDKIKAQQIRNKYYLSFLSKESLIFTYISDTNKLYQLDNRDCLCEVQLDYLINELKNQILLNVNINNLFNPSKYLVSPLNSTKNFIDGKYFLTSHQEFIKNDVLRKIESSGYSISAIKGKAGTGKTLLTYDIAKNFSSHSQVLLIHCGQLSNGHEELKEDYDWHIIEAKFIPKTNFSSYKLIIVDEAQRIYPSQLKIIISEVKKNSINCIFSYDGMQTLKSSEIKNNVEYLIEQQLVGKPHMLKTKIRTNKEIATFIKAFFNKKEIINKINYPNIEINYFNNIIDAVEFVNHKVTENWKAINFTPSRHTPLPYDKYKISNGGFSDNAHRVIGQEYDNVICIVDKHFYYKLDGNLSTRRYTYKPYYHPTKMLFQIVTRCRLKLSIVIVKNNEIFERCMEILN